MLRRMDELYRSVKNNAITLTPVTVEQLALTAVECFHGKYPDQPVAVELTTHRQVLADLGHLSEAICNLLCNGYEAAVQAGREEPRVSLRIRGRADVDGSGGRRQRKGYSAGTSEQDF